MTIATVRSKIKERMETIPGMRGYAYPSSALPQVPAFILDYAEETADYAEPGNTTIWRFIGLLLVGQYDADKGYEELDDYLEKTGEKSIKAVLESGSDVGDYIFVSGCRRAGAILYKAFTQVFYGAEFDIEVGDTT